MKIKKYFVKKKKPAKAQPTKAVQAQLPGPPQGRPPIVGPAAIQRAVETAKHNQKAAELFAAFRRQDQHW